MSDAENTADNLGLRVSRRGALMGGALGLVAAAGVSELDPQVAMAASPGLQTTEPLENTSTVPEQLRLTWGADPTTQVTVSFSPPGSTAMPAPTLAYARTPIGYTNAGTVITLPAVSDFSLSTPRTGPTSTSYLDTLSQQTTYHYHVPLTGLSPDTEYFYEASDGAGATASGSFRTAASGRTAYRFTAFGDIGTPYSDNPSGYTWTESSDVSPYTVNGVISPGDGNGPGLFHLMLADLSYANVNPANMPMIWRDYFANASRASQNQPWMPIQGNHELEYGGCDIHGSYISDPSARTSAQWYNGPYGVGNYLARHLLPDNGLTNWDNNSLQGSFYSFQVGTVLFVCLNTNDVVYQNPQLVSTTASGKNYAGTYYGVDGMSNPNPQTLPQGTGVGQFQSTGNLTAGGTGVQLVPDTGSGTPNLQTQWLERTLATARAGGSSVDMIVVCEHHCALSTGPNNGVDLAIRAAWLPLYDQYEVDLVIGGHDHDYERSYPVRGYDAPSGTATAAFTNPWGTYALGATVDTRRPTVVSTEPTMLANGQEAWNTGTGTVFLQLGGAGAAAGALPTAGKSSTRQAEVWAVNTGVGAKQCATEDAPWSANYDTSDNYGYAVFDVDPGAGPGETTLTYRWFQVPTVANGGTTPAQTTPYEEFVFMRAQPAGSIAVTGQSGGSVSSGSTLTASPSGFAANSSYTYQWLRNDTTISGATGADYTTGAADVGTQLAVQIDVSAQAYPSVSATSSPVFVTSPTASGGAISLRTPTISGTKRVGDELTATVVSGTSGVKLAYQWLRGGKAIPKATSARYKLVAADANQYVRVKVTATLSGYTTATAESAAIKIPVEFFTKTTKPKIIGTATVGHSLAAELAAWSPGATFAYEWLLNGRVIKGAIHRFITLEKAYAHKRLSVRVTGRRTGYASVVATSAAVVITAKPVRALRPRVSGRAMIGETLHAHIGEWPVGTQFAYRWFADGRVITGATGHSLRILAQHRGMRIALEVTGTLAGHEPARAVSAQTRVVRRPWTLL